MRLISTFVLLLSLCAVLKLNQFQASMANAQQTQQELTTLLLDRTKNCILHNEEIKGKESIFNIIDSLNHSGTVVESGSDDLRTKYVPIQGSIEHVLACALVLGEITDLVGVIHTPTPSTPLCTTVEHLDDQLLEKSIRTDSQKLLTVRSRAVVVREYLERGGKLFIAYPEGGLEQRSSQQQEIYKQELIKYPDCLIDTVLNCKEMDPSKIGATYFFKSSKDELYAFSIKANQANKPVELSEWGLWFGKIENPLIHERVSEILDYLAVNGDIDLEPLFSLETFKPAL